MNILRHLYLSTAMRSPDEPVAPEPEIIEPVAEVIPEPVAEIPPEPEPVVEPAKPEPPHGNKGQTPWFQRVIAEVRQEKNQERTAREAAEQRAADLQAIIERLQADPKAAPPAAKPKEQPAPDFQAAVKAQAAKDRLYEDTMTVRSAGESAFPDFNQSLGILTAIGATNDDFVSDVLAVDKAGAHVIFDKLAKDPEKAASLVGMDSRRRIAELTRMADAPKTEVKQEAPKAPVSKAPSPAPRLAPLATAQEIDPNTPEGNDKMTDAQWEKWFKETQLKRA